MNKFFEYIQPTIVRASYDEELPENVRGRYFINFNVFGIKYFEENYILTENSNNFQYLLLKENLGVFKLEDLTETFETESIVDIPRIYIDITDKFVNDDTNLFKSFVYQAFLENAIWAEGIDDFLCGQDYYVNYTLYNYLALTDKLAVADFGCRLPNYLDENGFRTKYWMDLSNDPYKDYTNLDYFNEKNKLLTNTFSEDELNNFYSTFCGLILKHTKISDETRASGNNPIYDLVLHYYANFKNDSGSDAIAMILGSLYSNSSTTSSGCGCNTLIGGETTTVTNQSCYDLYKQAMATWLKTMLGDIQFYKDWFTIFSGTNTLPNDVLVDNLVTLITEFLASHPVLSFGLNVTAYNSTCPTVSYSMSDCNKAIMNNYLKVLEYNKKNELDKNKNKIKLYGEQFGELLPSLQF